MSFVKGAVNRGETSSGWRLSKYHELLHIPVDAKNMGSLANVDASKGGNRLKTWAKLPAETVRNRGEESFLADLATRIYENRLLELATDTQVVPNANQREETFQAVGDNGVQIHLKKLLMTLTRKGTVQDLNRTKAVPYTRDARKTLRSINHIMQCK